MFVDGPSTDGADMAAGRCRFTFTLLKNPGPGQLLRGVMLSSHLPQNLGVAAVRVIKESLAALPEAFVFEVFHLIGHFHDDVALLAGPNFV